MALPRREQAVSATEDNGQDDAVSAAPARNSLLAAAGRIAIVTLVYLLVAKLGLSLTLVQPSVSPIWPATGLAIAAVLLWGLPVAVGILFGAFAANFLTAGTETTSAFIALGNMIEALLAAGLINSWCGGASRVFASVRATILFALICTGAATASASIGVTTLNVAGLIAPENVSPMWLIWWAGDLTGALVVTPFLVLWAENKNPLYAHARNALESAAIFVCALGLGAAAFSPLLTQTFARTLVAFAVMAPLLWATIRSGQRDTATVIFILAGFAVWGVQRDGGPFIAASPSEAYLLLLAFLVSIVMPVLALSAGVAAHRPVVAQWHAWRSHIQNPEE